MRQHNQSGSRRRRMRRGESLTEVTMAILIFSIAIGSFGTEWVHTRQQQALIRQQQVAARIAERTVEERRAVGTAYLPNKPPTGTPWQTDYCNASGAVVSGPTANGYLVKTWVSYLPNPATFPDGTANAVNGTSLREITVRIYGIGLTVPILETRTLVAPVASSN